MRLIPLNSIPLRRPSSSLTLIGIFMFFQSFSKLFSQVLRLDLNHPRLQTVSIIIRREKLDILLIGLVRVAGHECSVQRNVTTRLSAQKQPHHRGLLILQQPQRSYALGRPGTLGLLITIILDKLEHLSSHLVQLLFAFFGDSCQANLLMLLALVIITSFRVFSLGRRWFRGTVGRCRCQTGASKCEGGV